MEIKKNEKYTFISVNKDTFSEFTQNIDDLKSNHLVVEISENINISKEEISLFLKISTDFNTIGTSFVIIKSRFNSDDFPEIVNIVPTLQEAEDILEMEAIERDLGL